jgi:hypothetical protein
MRSEIRIRSVNYGAEVGFVVVVVMGASNRRTNLN